MPRTTALDVLDSLLADPLRTRHAAQLLRAVAMAVTTVLVGLALLVTAGVLLVGQPAVPALLPAGAGAGVLLVRWMIRRSRATARGHCDLGRR